MRDTPKGCVTAWLIMAVVVLLLLVIAWSGYSGQEVYYPLGLEGF